MSNFSLNVTQKQSIDPIFYKSTCTLLTDQWFDNKMSFIAGGNVSDHYLGVNEDGNCNPELFLLE